MLIEEYVYNGRNNTIQLSLYRDGQLITHTAVTRCQVQVGATLLDSNTNPTYFDLTNSDRVILKFSAAGLTAGTYTATLYVFDATNTNGINWGDFLLTVK